MKPRQKKGLTQGDCHGHHRDGTMHGAAFEQHSRALSERAAAHLWPPILLLLRAHRHKQLSRRRLAHCNDSGMHVVEEPRGDMPEHCTSSSMHCAETGSSKCEQFCALSQAACAGDPVLPGSALHGDARDMHLVDEPVLEALGLGNQLLGAAVAHAARRGMPDQLPVSDLKDNCLDQPCAQRPALQCLRPPLSAPCGPFTSESGLALHPLACP